jgi:hypothetical protein
MRRRRGQGVRGVPHILIVVRAPRPLRDVVLGMVGAGAVAACLPLLRYVSWFGDEGVLVHGVTRLLAGETLYRNVFSFLPPGGYFIVASWMWLVGDSLPAVRALAIALVALTTCMLYRACVTAGVTRFVAVCLALGWVVCAQGDWTIVNYHPLGTVFGMAAMLTTLEVVGREGPARRLAFLAGLLGGASAMVIQSRGTLIAAACLASLLVVRRSRADMLALIGGTAILPLAAVAWLMWQGTLGEAIRTTVVLTAQRYAPIQGVPFGSWADRRSRPLVALFPVTAVLLGARVLVHKREERPRMLALFCFFVAAFVGCFPRPDIVHIAFSAPLAIPLFAGCVAPAHARQGWWQLRYAAPTLLLLILLPSCLAYVRFARTVMTSPRHPSARGDVVFGSDLEPQSAAALIRHLRSLPMTDRLFFYPYDPMLIYLSGRTQTGPFDIFAPGYSLPEEYRLACEIALAHAQHVVIDTKRTSPEALKAVFPAMRDPRPPEMVAFERALREHSTLQQTFGPYEVRRRGADIPAGSCDGVLAP